MNEIHADLEYFAERRSAARNDLRQSLANAVGALATARRSLDLLAVPLYDVEYAEGGVRTDDLRAFLADASRSLRAAERINRDIP